MDRKYAAWNSLRLDPPPPHEALPPHVRHALRLTSTPKSLTPFHVACNNSMLLVPVRDVSKDRDEGRPELLYLLIPHGDVS